ncbi:C-type lectin-like [Trinorchestia longiramus]|nr:C-type lectin-like [Trinorchestia longiramus]
MTSLSLSSLSTAQSTSFSSIVLKKVRIFNETATLIASQLPRSCSCHYGCKVMNCSTYSVTLLKRGDYECRLSNSPVPKYAWQDHISSYVVHNTDYKMTGRHFYKYFSPATNTEGRKLCTLEKGQLPVLLDDAVKTEFLIVMEWYGTEITLITGVETAWVGALRTDKTNDTGKEPPTWTFFNGTQVVDNSLPTDKSQRCYIINAQQNASIELSSSCADMNGVICQRDI